MSRRRVLAAIVLAIVAATVVASGFSRTSAQNPPVFRGGVDLVEMDVSVLDANRRPVRGLLASDFVLEDGKPQAVSLFSEVEVPGPDPVAAPWMRDVGPDVQTNIPADRRLVVIVMDDAMIQANPFALQNARKMARRVIEHLGPADLTSVVFTLDNRNTQDFTTDHARLNAAVDKFSLQFRDMAGSVPGGDSTYTLYSARIFGEVVKYLSEVPHRRKMIIYIGQGLPSNLDGGVIGTPGGPLSANELENRILQTVSPLFRQAREANVSIYTLDACGLRIDAIGFVQGSSRTCLDGPEVSYLKTIAEGTGGRAIVNTNEPDAAIDALFVENSSYYLLGFRSADSGPAPRTHRLEVRANRPGLLVRTRNGYAPPKDEKSARGATPMAKSLAGVLPNPDISLQVHAAPFAQPGKGPRVAIVLGVHQSDLASATERVTEDLSLQVRAFTPEGDPRGSFRQSARVGVRASATGEIQYEVLTGMDLKPGRYQLRLAAESVRQRKNGSVYVDVTVPDFAKAPLSLSGVELAATPSPAAAPKTALTALMPVVPTSRREFQGTDKVTAFWKIYEGGKAPLQRVRLEIEVLGSGTGDGRLSGQSATIEPQQFDQARSAPHQFDLDLSALEPGPYLLRTTATAGKESATRDVRFRVLAR